MKKLKITQFLTFNGNAEEAMRFYASVLPNAKIIRLERYGKDHPFAADGEENRVLHGALSINGQEIMFLDMDAAHPAPEFCWSSSLYIDCGDESEFDTVFNGLSQDGFVMMKEEPFMQFRKVAWVTDKFGVTWQPVLE